MNWLKVKKILVIIFILLNVILKIMYDYKEGKLYTLSNSESQQIRELLYKNHINIYAYLPDKYYPMAKLKVRARKIDDNSIKKVVKNIFNGRAKFSLLNGGTAYTNDDKTETIIFKENTVLYTNIKGKYPPKKFNPSEARTIAEKFVKQLINNKFKIQYATTRTKDDYYIIEFNENYKGKKIFSSDIKVKVYKYGITEVKMVLYEPVHFVENKRYIYPPDEVLYNFTNFIKGKKDGSIFINYMNIGYDLGVKFNADEAVALPYYKINLADGNTYYINAYKNDEIIQK